MARRQIRRPATAPNHRPMASGSSTVAVDGLGHGEDPSKAKVAEMAELQEEMLQQFMDLLGDDRSLGGTDRDQIRQELVNALDAVEGSGESFQAPDRAVWMDAAKTLQSVGAVSDDEANALIRQLDQALSSFEREESKLAIEFSRRMSSDGEAAALEWLQQNRHALLNESKGAGNAQSAMSQGVGGEPLVLATDAIRSKARRVRGPPVRGGR